MRRKDFGIPRQANSDDTTPIGKLGVPSDVGFHLVGDQFLGAKYYPNLVPANDHLNSYPNPPWKPTPGSGGAFGQLEWW